MTRSTAGGRAIKGQGGEHRGVGDVSEGGKEGPKDNGRWVEREGGRESKTAREPAMTKLAATNMRCCFAPSSARRRKGAFGARKEEGKGLWERGKGHCQ